MQHQNQSDNIMKPTLPFFVEPSTSQKFFEKIQTIKQTQWFDPEDVERQKQIYPDLPVVHFLCVDEMYFVYSPLFWGRIANSTDESVVAAFCDHVQGHYQTHPHYYWDKETPQRQTDTFPPYITLDIFQDKLPRPLKSSHSDQYYEKWVAQTQHAAISAHISSPVCERRKLRKM